MEKIVHDFATEIRMDGEEAKEICKLGQGEECCAFLTAGVNGFECIKMSYPMNSSIHQRLEKGTMNAKGRGEWKGCPWNKKQGERKMTIIECLKKETDMRLTSGSKWLVWHDTFEEWVVLEHRYYGKKTIILCRTPSEEEAIKHLTGGE